MFKILPVAKRDLAQLAVFLSFTLFTSYAFGQSATYEWAATVGGPGVEVSSDVVADAEGNVYLLGWFEQTVDFDFGEDVFNMTSAGDKDIFLMKVNSQGDFVWAKQFGGPVQDRATNLAIDAEGDVYFTGYFGSTITIDPDGENTTFTAQGSRDFFLAKVDGDGNFYWIKQIGGNASELARGLRVDGEGFIYISGEFDGGTTDLNPGDEVEEFTSIDAHPDAFVLKLDSEANFIWAKTFGSYQPVLADGIDVDASGNVYLGGRFASPVDFDPDPESEFELTVYGSYDAFILKLDSDGNFAWAEKIGGNGTDYGYDISVDNAGNVYCVGEFVGTADFDPGEGTYNLTSGGGYVRDAFVSKLDTEGNFVWAKQFTGMGQSTAMAMSMDATGNVVIAGEFAGSTDFDPNPESEFIMTSNGDYDSFVTILDADGNFIWAHQTGGSFNERSQSVFIDGASNVYTVGHYQGQVDFNPLPDSEALLTSFSNTRDGWLQKISFEVCTGMPDLGATLVTNGADTLCADNGMQLNLSVENSYVFGAQYQWQYNTGDGWEDIENATNATYSTSLLGETTVFRNSVTCIESGETDHSDELTVEIMPLPEIAVTPSISALCDGGQATFIASGAAEYSWSPAIGLNQTTGAVVISTATMQQNYTVTGTDEYGCTNTASVTVIPLEEYVISTDYSPAAVCSAGEPITVEVQNLPEAISEGGELEFQWMDEAMTVVQDWSTDTEYTFTPDASGQYHFTINVRSTSCPDGDMPAGHAMVEVGFGATVNPMETNCDTPGSFTLSQTFGPGSTTTYYTQDFLEPITNEPNSTTTGATHVEEGRLHLTEAEALSFGGFSVLPDVENSNIPNQSYEISFNLTADQSENGGGVAFAYSFGDDAYLNNNIAGQPALHGGLGHGRGTKLRVVFDSYDNSANQEGNVPGIYVRYGEFNFAEIGPGSETVLAYSPNMSWLHATDVPVGIKISSTGMLSVSLAGIIVLDQVQLPAEYQNADRSNWIHSFGARTGDLVQNAYSRHAIDNLEIRYKGVEFGLTELADVEEPEEWQVQNTFDQLAAGTYNIWMRNPADPTCNELVETVEIEILSLPEVAASPTTYAVCEGGNVIMSATGAQTYVWSPAIELNATTGPSVIATPTQARIYTITGTDQNGCVNTTTASVIPVSEFAPVTAISPETVCSSGEFVTVNVSNAPGSISGGGNWSYQWLNEDSTVAQSWSPVPQFSFAPEQEGTYTYQVQMTSTSCPEDSLTGLAVFDVGFGAHVDSIDVNCNTPEGSFLLSDIFGQYGEEAFYTNDFSSTVENDSTVELVYGAQINEGRLILTESVLQQHGAFTVYPDANDLYWPDAGYEVSFLMSVDEMQNGGGAAFSYSFGDDAMVVDQLNSGHGHGSKLRIIFDEIDTWNWENNVEGVYLTYGYASQVQPGPETPGVLAYNPTQVWQNVTDAPVKIKITPDGKVSVSVGGILIFNGIQLPDAYLEEDQSNWVHTLAANTEQFNGATFHHAIDDLKITYKGLEYGITSAATQDAPEQWQTQSMFEGLEPGSYNLWINNPSDEMCHKNLGTFNIDDINPVVDFGEDTSLCEGETLTLDAENENSAVSYLWSDNSQEQTLTVSSTGSYWAMVTDTAGCISVGSIYINVTAPPSVDGLVVNSNGLDVVASAVNPQNAASYHWDFGDGTQTTSTAPIEYHTYAEDGDYDVTLTVISGAAGCTNVVVDETISVVTGIEQLSADKAGLGIYPNPAQDVITVVNEQQLQIERIRVFSIAGEMVLDEQYLAADRKSLDISALSNGVYFIGISTSENEYNLRLVVNH